MTTVFGTPSPRQIPASWVGGANSGLSTKEKKNRSGSRGGDQT